MNRPHKTPAAGRLRLGLTGLVMLQAVGYTLIAWMSPAFAHDQSPEGRPILAILGLFWGCFACSVASTAIAVRLGESRRLAWVIVAAALGFRGLLLFTPPIQEVDIYRYIWDGEVAAHGISPYRYPPAVVLAAHDDKAPVGDAHDPHDPHDPRDARDAHAHDDPSLARLVGLLKDSPGLADTLGRVHFQDLTTLYPPVSQAVFAGAAMLMPADASAHARVTIMKSVLLVFDMAVLGTVFWLLRAAGKPMGLAILYGWCPLVIKECANSGHLDSIAVCLTMASLCAAAGLWRGVGARAGGWGMASAVLLGLAAGAKIYPLILVPLLTVATASRGGLRRAAMVGGMAILTSAVCLAPMAWLSSDDHLPVAADSSGTTMGLAAFVSRWEINDLIFMVVFENLRPANPEASAASAWFAIVPPAWRMAVIGPLAELTGLDPDRAAFWVTRGLTAAVFLLILLALVRGVARNGSLSRFLEAAFLTIAWFWLLAPTQNAWYWTWAVPLVPFARGRAWIAMSGLAFLSYLRFWLVSRYPEAGAFGTGYNGSQFFDFFIPWVEFGPWMAWLAMAAMLRREVVKTPTRPVDDVCGPVHRDTGGLPLHSSVPDTSPVPGTSSVPGTSPPHTMEPRKA